MNQIAVEEIVDKFKLKQLNQTSIENQITLSDIKRPGIELAGFFDHFTPERVQILGKTETSFLNELPSEILEARLNKFLGYEIPCIIITRGLEPLAELIEISEKKQVPILSTDYSTTSFISRLTTYLEKKFAPQVIKHGVLVEVYGVGILIKGSSGIGKSESALDLVKRGHRLITDDTVIIKRVMRSSLIGSSPELSKHHLELRGLGIINVKTLFGAGAIREVQDIDLMIQLEKWDQKKNYDRLGLKDESVEILGVTLPKLVIPVKPGRNLAMVIEVAAMNFRLKSTGYNAAEEFTKRLENELKS
ncbi:HPr(Ser) kinase/phosphatase [Natroniella sp. ANB-PHB2]|uniref:HPr(Ser) kinase/phosphatase n=1 Tax=Natroniella sp. ANB-PHB2 TaxID=3384444 RepID=UPI0038D4C11C